MNLDEFLATKSGFVVPDDVVDDAIAAGCWTPDHQRFAFREWAKIQIRRAAKRTVNGVPVYGSIVIEDSDGKQVRAYKQEALFDLSDYQLVIEDYVRQGKVLRDRALGYVERAFARFGVQIHLDF